MEVVIFARGGGRFSDRPTDRKSYRFWTDFDNHDSIALPMVITRDTVIKAWTTKRLQPTTKCVLLQLYSFFIVVPTCAG